jgi:hypothetical protein
MIDVYRRFREKYCHQGEEQAKQTPSENPDDGDSTSLKASAVVCQITWRNITDESKLIHYFLLIQFIPVSSFPSILHFISSLFTSYSFHFSNFHFFLLLLPILSFICAFLLLFLSFISFFIYFSLNA